ncbi:Pre-mRNA cleavage complex II protein Clp1-domain-containing protein [Gorgonomyces haynaldii]|nr:Pre-mRNA cleavage complex II protein Clp1-domain-containing protein [Gorgonomyces haynaldii]
MIFELEKNQEFRFEVDPDKTVTIKVKDGECEYFGTELAVDVPYTFGCCKGAIYTYSGCTLEADGEFAVEYIGKETPMSVLLNLHCALENLRSQALTQGKQGPRVMIVGPVDVGKTVAAKILSNYCAKISLATNGHPPLFVDIDTNEGTISLPGTLAAMVLARPLDVELDFSAPETFMLTTPLAYYYGYGSPLEKPVLYNSMVSSLASKVNMKMQDELVKSAGIIVDTPHQFSEPQGFDHLTHAIKQFQIDCVLVIGQERLYNDLMKHYPDDKVTLLSMSKSGGVVSRDKHFRRKQQLKRMRHYFYGAQQDLTPFSRTISYADIAVRRVDEGTMVPSSALPIGHERKVQETKFVKVEPGTILLHSILMVTNAPLPGQQGSETKLYTPEEESQLILNSHVVSFVYISDADDTKRKLTVLCPNPTELPKTFLVMASLKWLE